MIVTIDSAADPRIADFTAIRERDLVGRQHGFIAEGEVVVRVLLERSRYRARAVLAADKLVDRIAPLVPDEVPLYVGSTALLSTIVGFPLHPAGAPSSTRAAHLAQVPVPMVFVHGDRDALAEPTLMAPVLAGLGARATVHVLPGADHGFAIRKRDGGDAHVLGEIADAVAAFARACAPTA